MQPPQSIEEIKSGLETTEKGGVRQSIRNCLTAVSYTHLRNAAKKKELEAAEKRIAELSAIFKLSLIHI